MEIVNEEEIRVQYIQHTGSDLSIFNAAKQLTGAQNKSLGKAEIKYIQSLAEYKHMTPFEHNSITLQIACPLFIRSLILRHRTFSYNELSGVISMAGDRYYIPKVFHDKDSVSELSPEVCKTLHELAEYSIMKTDENYYRLLDIGVSKEEARLILPQCMMTQFWMTGNLRNWFQFLAVRLESSSQSAGLLIGRKVLKELLGMYPIGGGALMQSMFSQEVLDKLKTK